jgi:dolichyl-phosphate-mannose--protein O-mannosyl transferase
MPDKKRFQFGLLTLAESVFWICLTFALLSAAWKSEFPPSSTYWLYFPTASAAAGAAIGCIAGKRWKGLLYGAFIGGTFLILLLA